MFALALALAASGCNAVFGLDPPGSGSGTDGGGGDDDADPGDGGNGGDGGGDDGGRPTMTGRVAVFQYDYVAPAGGVLIYTLDANFGPPAVDCADLIRIQGCAAQSCTPVEPNQRPASGTITYQGLTEASFIPDVTGHYPTTNGPGRMYNQGTSVQVTSSGGEVPGFVASLAAPGSVVFTSPMPVQSGAPPLIPRAADFTLTWQPMASGTLRITLGSGTPGLAILCEFPASAGMGKIAHEVLAELPAGAGSMATAVSTTVDVVAGDYTVTVRASAVAKVNSGDYAAGPVSLQ